jgi:hypothetical protein
VGGKPCGGEELGAGASSLGGGAQQHRRSGRGCGCGTGVSKRIRTTPTLTRDLPRPPLPPPPPRHPRRYIDGIRASADAAAREQLARVVEVLAGERVADFDACIAWARLKFNDYFHDRWGRARFEF